MAQKKIGAIIKLDGEKEYRQAVTACTKSVTMMRSEMKLVTAETAGNANSLESLSKKHTVLQKALKLSQEKQDAVQRGLQHAQDDYAKIGRQLEEYRNAAKDAQLVLDELTASGTASDEEIQAQTEYVASLNAAVSQGEEAYEKAGARVKDWETRLNNAKVETINANSAVNENAGLMKEAEEASDGCAHSIDEYGKKVKQAGNAADDSAACTASFADSLTKLQIAEIISGYLDKVTDAAIELASASYEAAQELDDSYDIIITKTGASGDALDDLSAQADDLFGSMAVDAADVGAAIGEVNTRFHQTGDELEDTAGLFLKFAQINETDVAGSIDQIDRLMDQFGVDASETGNVLGLLTKEAQSTGIGMDQLMSSIDSNSATLQDLGFGLAESADLLAKFEANGVDAQAAAKGLKTAVQNAASEGLDARDVLEQTITSIQNAKTETEAIQIAANTFGTKGAQVMARSIRDGRINLDDLTASMDAYGSVVTDTYMATQDPWDRMTVLTNNLKLAGSNLAGEFLDMLAPTIEDVTELVQKGTKAFKKLPQPIKQVTAVVVAVGAAAGVAGPKILQLYKTIEILKEASAVSKTLKALTTEKTVLTAATEAATVATEAESVATGGATAAAEGMTVAQTTLNTAMMAMPLVAVIAGLGAMAVAFTAAKNKALEENEQLQKLSKTSDNMVDSLESATDALNGTMESVTDNVDTVKAHAEVTDDLVDRLYQLEGQSSRTAAEQAEMESIVGQLNTMYPELSLSIDKSNGKLNKGKKEIKEYCDNAEKIALIKAYAKAAEEGYQALIEAQVEVKKASKDLETVQTEVNELQAKYDQAVADSTDAQAGYKGATQASTAEVIEAGNALQAGKEKLKEATAAQDEAEEAVRSAQETVDAYKAAEEELTEAVTGNTDATNENAQAQGENQSAQQASIEKAGESYTAYQNLSASQQQMAVDFTNQVTSMTSNIQSALESQMNMFEEFDAGTAMSTEQMLANMQSQIDGVTQWEQNLAELADKGINSDLLQKLSAMGPEGAAYVQTFNNMSTEELAQANELWTQSLDIQGMSNQWGQELQTAGAENIAAGMNGLTEVMQAAGADTVMGLVNGVQSAAAEAQAAGLDLGVNTVNSIDTGLGVSSPSWKTTQSGMFLDMGLANGMTNGLGLIVAAAGRLTTTINTSVNSTIARNVGIYRTAGLRVSQGLQQGMISGQPLVMMAGMTIAQTATTTVQNTVNAQLPLVRSAGLGVGSALASGLNDGKSEVAGAASSLGGSVSSAKDVVRSYYDDMYSAGKYLDSGLANGIRDGKSGVVNAAAEVVRAVVSTARSGLDVASPSKVGIWLGQMWDAGIAGGVAKGAGMIENAVKGSLDPMTRPVETSTLTSLEHSINTNMSRSSMAGMEGLIYEAVKAGMRDANIGIYLQDRLVGRSLRDMGVAFG